MDSLVFGIRHFAGRVLYDTAHFLETNRDVVPDDIVSVFHKSTCNFGFATHLFGSELKALYSHGIKSFHPNSSQMIHIFQVIMTKSYFLPFIFCLDYLMYFTKNKYVHGIKS